MGTWVGWLVCGGDWQFKTLFLVGQSSNPAGKDGEEEAPPNYRPAGTQKKKKEVKKSPASGRRAQTTDSKMNLPRTPNTSHPPTHTHTHTPHHHTRHKPARKPPITTRTAHTHPPPVWRRGRASPLRSPPVPPPNGRALARGARRATGARALAVQSCCIGPWRGGEALALREQGGAVAGVWQRWCVGGGPGSASVSASVSASASGQRVAGRCCRCWDMDMYNDYVDASSHVYSLPAAPHHLTSASTRALLPALHYPLRHPTHHVCALHYMSLSR
jgi:hypothetical protein